MLGSKKYSIKEALQSKSLFKMDTIAVINDVFTEVTCVYDLRDQQNHRLNHTNFNPMKAIRDDIEHFKLAKKFFKVLKRQFSLYKLEYQNKATPETATKIVKISNILNGELGQLYQIKSILNVIFTLIKTYKHTKRSKLKTSFRRIIQMLSNITTNNSLMITIAHDLNNILNFKVKSTEIAPKLMDARDKITDLLDEKSKPLI
jgi:hypothetical protein